MMKEQQKRIQQLLYKQKVTSMLAGWLYMISLQTLKHNNQYVLPPAFQVLYHEFQNYISKSDHCVQPPRQLNLNHGTPIYQLRATRVRSGFIYSDHGWISYQHFSYANTVYLLGKSLLYWGEPEQAPHRSVQISNWCK